MLPSQALTGMARPAPLNDAAFAGHEAVRFGYSIGALNFLIGVGVMSELLRAPVIYPIPNVLRALKGYLNRQGALVPVWDLSEVFDCKTLEAPAKQHAGSMLHRADQQSVLILGRNDDRVGVFTDGLPRAIRSVLKSSRLPVLPAMLQPHVHAAFFADEELWLEVNHDDLFQSLVGGDKAVGSMVKS